MVLSPVCTIWKTTNSFSNQLSRASFSHSSKQDNNELINIEYNNQKLVVQELMRE